MTIEEIEQRLHDIGTRHSGKVCFDDIPEMYAEIKEDVEALRIKLAREIQRKAAENGRKRNSEMASEKVHAKD